MALDHRHAVHLGLDRRVQVELDEVARLERQQLLDRRRRGGELGRTRISIKNILQLAQGSVVELEAMAGEPMDVLVNGYLIAQGEVVVVNDKFGIRLTDIVTPSERMRRLSKGG